VIISEMANCCALQVRSRSGVRSVRWPFRQSQTASDTWSESMALTCTIRLLGRWWTARSSAISAYSARFPLLVHCSVVCTDTCDWRRRSVISTLVFGW